MVKVLPHYVPLLNVLPLRQIVRLLVLEKGVLFQFLIICGQKLDEMLLVSPEEILLRESLNGHSDEK